MTGPQCPVCDERTNSSGMPFMSEWAVACHVAGKIISGNRLHNSWARTKLGEFNQSRSVPKLAELLLTAVHRDLKELKSLHAQPPITPLNLMHDIEVKLHDHIRRRLESHFGVENESWWVNGIQLPIREDCAKRREADPARDVFFAYAYLVDLKSILDKNWLLFEADFQRVRRVVTAKKQFLDLLTQLNETRNRHSHPIRAPKLGTKAYNSDLELAQRLSGIIDEFCRFDS